METPAKVLIVDDEPDIELLIRQWFRRRGGGYEFHFARNGKEALHHLERDPEIDVVVTDINMPEMDGLTLLAQLNHNHRLRKTIILSAYGDLPNIRLAMNRGAFDFLTKPIDFQDFEVTLQKTLQELAAAREGMEAQAELTALQHELAVAARIQQSILPRKFPPFPDRREFEIFADMTPARQVGGDFYDFFLVDEDRLGFVIGDVSGKGVPAALFMAVSRTLLRATAMQGLAPDECLQYMNRVLGKQAQEGVFVTIFYGILNTGSGELEFCLAGHNPPYLLSPRGEIRPLEQPACPVVGLLDRICFESGHTRIQPGEAIFLFTDGVTEALDASETFYSEKRLKARLRELSGRPAEDLVREVGKDVTHFIGDAAPADDITMLAVQYLG